MCIWPVELSWLSLAFWSKGFSSTLFFVWHKKCAENRKCVIFVTLFLKSGFWAIIQKLPFAKHFLNRHTFLCNDWNEKTRSIPTSECHLITITISIIMPIIIVVIISTTIAIAIIIAITVTIPMQYHAASNRGWSIIGKVLLHFKKRKLGSKTFLHVSYAKAMDDFSTCDIKWI